jgi:nucleoside-diphosphate-sugar epimerase
MSAAPLAVVTGASGFVGSHIVDELLRHDARVRCLLRPRSSTQWLDGKPVEIVRLEEMDLDRLSAAVADATWIVHAAGTTQARSAREFHEINVGGTERVLRAAIASNANLERFLYISSQAAGGPAADRRPVVESDRPDPASTYGVSKLRGEELTMLLKNRMPVVTIRPPAVYGPRDKAFLRLYRLLKIHVMPILRAGERFTLVYAEDLARAAYLALTHPRAPGEVYFVGEPESTDSVEMGECIRGSLGTKAITVRPPGFVLQMGALAAELAGFATGRPPLLSREKLKEITAGDWLCSSAKIRSQLGWTPRVGLEEGIARTTAWYREAGWI